MTSDNDVGKQEPTREVLKKNEENSVPAKGSPADVVPLPSTQRSVPSAQFPVPSSQCGGGERASMK